MRFTKRVAAAVVLVAIVGLMLAVAFPTPARGAGSAPVTVVNTAAEPVPVALQGTGTVAGTVNALQSGAWTVGVSTLPAMTLAAGTTVGISGFSNTRETPLFTLDVEQSALQAYAVQLCENAIYGCQGGATATLPVGQRFVIEQVSGRCAIGGSGDLGNAILMASLNGQQYSHVLVGQLDGGGSGNARVFNNLTRIYADGGVVDGLSLSGTGNESCVVVASGRLVALPAPPFP